MNAASDGWVVEASLETALSMHDVLLLNAPAGANHDQSLCPFCVDWSMSEDGVPSGHARLDLADAKAPYGSVEYADPGYQSDKVKRYPIDTVAHARAAWTYIHQAGNAEKYTADQLAEIRTKVSGALEKFGTEAEDKEVEKTKKLADAKAGPQKPDAAKPSTSNTKPAKKPEVASEGGTQHMEDTMISKDTHEALLERALRDATAALEAEKAALVSEVAALTTAVETHETEIATLKSENERVNADLDTAQIALHAAEEKASELEADIAAKEEAAVKADLAAARLAQVKNLGLFAEEFAEARAPQWAELDEAAWTERVEEFKATAKPATSTGASATTDTASAMTGTNENSGSAEKPSARRMALGLG